MWFIIDIILYLLKIIYIVIRLKFIKNIFNWQEELEKILLVSQIKKFFVEILKIV